MALVKEDGTGVDGANTYVLAADARTYAQARGVTLPSDDSAVELLLIQAMDYLEAFRSRYQGSKTYTGIPNYYAYDHTVLPLPEDINTHAAQDLQWPRVNVYIDNVPLSPNKIPKELISAQCQCSLEVFAGNDLSPTTTGQVVKSEKVDVIETVYMTGQEMGFAENFGPTFPKVDALLEPLFGSGGALRTVRV